MPSCSNSSWRMRRISRPRASRPRTANTAARRCCTNFRNSPGCSATACACFSRSSPSPSASASSRSAMSSASSPRITTATISSCTTTTARPTRWSARSAMSTISTTSRRASAAASSVSTTAASPTAATNAASRRRRSRPRTTASCSSRATATTRCCRCAAPRTASSTAGSPSTAGCAARAKARCSPIGIERESSLDSVIAAALARADARAHTAQRPHPGALPGALSLGVVDPGGAERAGRRHAGARQAARDIAVLAHHRDDREHDHPGVLPDGATGAPRRFRLGGTAWRQRRRHLHHRHLPPELHRLLRRQRAHGVLPGGGAILPLRRRRCRRAGLQEPRRLLGDGGRRRRGPAPPRHSPLAHRATSAHPLFPLPSPPPPALAALAALSGIALYNFWAALALLGVGWNFLYVGGTTLLTAAYRPEERAKTQAANEFLTFGVVAMAAFASGGVMARIGWNAINYATFPLLLIAAATTVWYATVSRPW